NDFVGIMKSILKPDLATCLHQQGKTRFKGKSAIGFIIRFESIGKKRNIGFMKGYILISISINQFDIIVYIACVGTGSIDGVDVIYRGLDRSVITCKCAVRKC